MQFFSLYESYFKQSLTNTQVQTLKILVWLITVQKTVKIERLAACFPLPVKYENLRKHIQRFLTLCSLSFPLFWFQIITMIINGHFIKKSGYQNYICRLTKLRRKDRRDSNFWVGIYGKLWVIAWEYLIYIVQGMMNLSPQKKPYYQRRLKAMSLLLD